MESHLNLGELRIGNHFKWSELASMGKDYDKVDLDNIKYHQFFEPIKLSEEILLKAGFEAKSVYDNYILNGIQISSSFRVLSTNERGGFWLCGSHEIRVYTLHQLQNLYFALTGEELTINL